MGVNTALARVRNIHSGNAHPCHREGHHSTNSTASGAKFVLYALILCRLFKWHFEKQAYLESLNYDILQMGVKFSLSLNSYF